MHSTHQHTQLPVDFNFFFLFFLFFLFFCPFDFAQGKKTMGNKGNKELGSEPELKAEFNQDAMASYSFWLVDTQSGGQTDRES